MCFRALRYFKMHRASRSLAKTGSLRSGPRRISETTFFHVRFSVALFSVLGPKKKLFVGPKSWKMHWKIVLKRRVEFYIFFFD